MHILKIGKLIVVASFIGIVLCIMQCQTDTPQGDPAIITDSCDVMTQDCTGINEMCSNDDSEGIWICMQEGTKSAGESCTKSSECRKSNICVNDMSSSTCRTLCENNLSCDSNNCQSMEDGSGLGICMP